MAIQANEVFGLIQDTSHLPDSGFVLGLADVLTQTAIQEFPKTSRRASRVKLLEDISNDLKYALMLFAQDKKNYTSAQKEGFLKRKYGIDQNLKKLQVIHIKMLIKELEVV